VQQAVLGLAPAPAEPAMAALPSPGAAPAPMAAPASLPASLNSIDVVASIYMGYESIWPVGGFSPPSLPDTLYSSLATSGYQVNFPQALVDSLY